MSRTSMNIERMTSLTPEIRRIHLGGTLPWVTLR